LSRRTDHTGRRQLGEHNVDILQGELGLPDDELAALEAAGVIGSAGQGVSR